MRLQTHQVVLPLNPAKALPLFAAELVNAFSTSDKPWGPLLSMDLASPGSAIARPHPTRITAGSTRM